MCIMLSVPTKKYLYYTQGSLTLSRQGRKKKHLYNLRLPFSITFLLLHGLSETLIFSFLRRPGTNSSATSSLEITAAHHCDASCIETLRNCSKEDKVAMRAEGVIVS